MAALLYRLGFALRETGQAIDRVGCMLAGSKAFQEDINRHRVLSNLLFKKPSLGEGTWIAPTATVVGDVNLGDKVSVWYGCVLRGDGGSISVGSGSNLQDSVVVETSATNLHEHGHGVTIGENVTVGHQATLKNCTVESGSLIGMKATLLDGVKVESNAMVAAGAVVSSETVVPSGQLWGGNPAKFLRNLNQSESDFMITSAIKYQELADEHAAVTNEPLEQVAAKAE